MARFCFRTDQSSSNVTMTPTWDNSWSVRIDWSIGPRQTGSSVRSPADLKLPPHLDSPGLKKHGFLTNRGNKTGPSGRSSPEAHLLDYYLHLPEVNCWVIDADGRLTAGHTGEFIHHNTSCLLCEVAQQQHWRAEIQNLRSRTWDPEAGLLCSCSHWMYFCVIVSWSLHDWFMCVLYFTFLLQQHKTQKLNFKTISWKVLGQRPTRPAGPQHLYSPPCTRRLMKTLRYTESSVWIQRELRLRFI